MIEWSESDLAIRDAVREWIDKEIRPNLDELETGELPPYDLIRKFFADFGIADMASAALEKELARERARLEGAAPKDADSTSNSSSLEGMDSMGAVVISELAGVSLGTVASVGVSLGLGAGTIMAKGTLAQKERWLPKLVTAEHIAALAIT